jgi:GTP-binding protein
MPPIIAIVGRPNVGKSTLFNRLVGRRLAIVEDLPGVTRDRHYAETEVLGRHFVAVDTGGFEPETQDGMLVAMRAQAQIAIDEADGVILVFDGREGLCPSDQEIARMLIQAGKPTLFAVNKIDGPRHDPLLAEFWRLGVDALHPISAEHGQGVLDLMEALWERLPEEDPAAADAPAGQIRVAVVGKPNVGKSTLVNRLLGEERMLTSATPGTTRDSIDTELTVRPDPKAIARAEEELERVRAEVLEIGSAAAEEAEAAGALVAYAEAELAMVREPRRFLFIDTAGIRRRKTIHTFLEKASVVRAFKSIDRAEVCLLVIDAVEGVSDQDMKLAGLIQAKGRACILIVNKWDAVPDKDTYTTGTYVKDLRDRLDFVSWAPVLFVSGLTGQRVHRILDEVTRVRANYLRRVRTSEVNRFVEELSGRTTPPMHKGRHLRIYYASQVSAGPPTFLLNVNDPQAMQPAYERFLANRLRERWDFEGTPVKIAVRGRAKRDRT